MNRIFSFGLYREGLKKVRLIGIIAAVLCIVITALVPIFSMVDRIHHAAGGWETVERQVSVVAIDELAKPLLLILLFTPVLIYSMFSYLNKRTESDFFHSIPYRRETVYLSFTAAAMTWVFGIIIATLAVAGILWGVHPYATFVFADLLRLGLAYLLSTMFLAGMMLTAMMLTGTLATNLFIFVLFASFVRVFGWLTTMCLTALAPVYDISFSVGRFLKADFSLPYQLFDLVLGNPYGNTLFSNTSLFVYTGVCAVLLFVAAGILYRFRKSEMAGNSAPSRALQHVYRCAFTLPLVLGLVAQLLIQNIAEGGILIIVVAILLVYYLYELITTKKFKRLLSATPFLGVLVVAGAVFAGAILLVTNGIFNENIQAREVKSVAFSETNQTSDYFEAAASDIEIDNCDAVNLIVDKLFETEKAQKNGQRYPGVSSDDWDRIATVSIKIRLTSGRVIVRNIWMTTQETQKLQEYFRVSPEYMTAMTTLPPESSFIYFRDEFSCTQEAWNLFLEEFESFDEKTKYEVLRASTLNINGRFIGFYVNVRYNYQSYYLQIPVTDKTPKTLQKFLREIDEVSEVSNTMQLLHVMAEDSWWQEHSESELDGQLLIIPCGSSSDKSADNLFTYLYSNWDNHKSVKQLYEFLSSVDPGAKEGTYWFYLRYDAVIRTDSKTGKQTQDVHNTMTLYLNEEEYTRFCKLLDAIRKNTE